MARLLSPVITCRGCGCDDNHACEGGCSWVLLDVPWRRTRPTGVCSTCAENVEWDPQTMATMGTEPMLDRDARAILRGAA